MDEVEINTSKTITLTLPQDPDDNEVSVTLYHELGSTVYGPVLATRASAGVYNITFGQLPSGDFILNSGGKYRAVFIYSVSSQAYSQSKFFNVYTPYISYDQFFESHPELEDSFGNIFNYFLKRAKNAIDTFCGQTFEVYLNKEFTIEGTGSSTLRLPVPISRLEEVIQDPGTENEEILQNSTISNIEKVKQPFNFETTYTLKFKKPDFKDDTVLSAKFKSDATYKIKGDFGWLYVPENIKQAADLIMADMMNNDSEYRMHGVREVDMDSISFKMRDSFYDSTGNIEADVLLMDYTLFVMDYVI